MENPFEYIGADITFEIFSYIWPYEADLRQICRWFREVIIMKIGPCLKMYEFLNDRNCKALRHILKYSKCCYIKRAKDFYDNDEYYSEDLKAADITYLAAYVIRIIKINDFYIVEEGKIEKLQIQLKSLGLKLEIEDDDDIFRLYKEKGDFKYLELWYKNISFGKIQPKTLSTLFGLEKVTAKIYTDTSVGFNSSICLLFDRPDLLLIPSIFELCSMDFLNKFIMVLEKFPKLIAERNIEKWADIFSELFKIEDGIRKKKVKTAVSTKLKLFTDCMREKGAVFFKN